MLKKTNISHDSSPSTSFPFVSGVSAFEAKLWGAWKGLKLARERGFTCVELHMGLSVGGDLSPLSRVIAKPRQHYRGQISLLHSQSYEGELNS